MGTAKPQAVEIDARGVRLQKFLASAGIGSRRSCEEYIEAGRVSVDGRQVHELGVRVHPRQQVIRVDGEVVKTKPKRYYLLNKPAGYLCTNRDPSGRPRAVDLVPQNDQQLFTVGRLDENSEGLLLVTNDGNLADRLAHPRYEVPRRYRVQVAGRPNRRTLEKLRRGMYFAEGKFRVQSIRSIGKKGDSTFLEVVLTEGKNREVRRMFARAGHKVLHLERIGFGPLQLGRLGVGRCRRLKKSELKALRELVKTTSAKGESAGGRRGRVRKKSTR